MRPVSNTMPQTMAEWQELIAASYENGQEAYAAACAEARANAEAQWEQALPALRAQLLEEIDRTVLVARDSSGHLLAANDREILREKLVQEAEAQLTRKQERLLQECVSTIELPRSRAAWETHFDCFRPQDIPTTPESVAATGIAPGKFYQVGNEFYDICSGCFAAAPADSSLIIPLGGEQTHANLRSTLEFYQQAHPLYRDRRLPAHAGGNHRPPAQPD